METKYSKKIILSVIALITFLPINTVKAGSGAAVAGGLIGGAALGGIIASAHHHHHYYDYEPDVVYVERPARQVIVEESYEQPIKKQIRVKKQKAKQPAVKKTTQKQNENGMSKKI